MTTIKNLDSTTLHNLIQAELTAVASRIIDAILAAEKAGADVSGMPVGPVVAAKIAAKQAAPKPVLVTSADPELAAHFAIGTGVISKAGKAGAVAAFKAGPSVRMTPNGPQVFVQYTGAPCPMWIACANLAVNGAPVKPAKKAPAKKPAKEAAPAKPEAPEAAPVVTPQPEPTPVKPITEEGSEVFKAGKWYRRNADGGLTPAPDLDKKYSTQNGGTVTSTAFKPGMLVKPVKRTKRQLTATVVAVDGNKLTLRTDGSKTEHSADASLWQAA